MKFKLSNKTALICGGSSGIGLAIAKELEKHKKLKIILLSNNQKKLDDAKLSFKKPEMIDSYKIDLSKSNEVKKFINELSSSKIGVDILINNSGGPKAGDIFNLENADWENAIQSVDREIRENNHSRYFGFKAIVLAHQGKVSESKEWLLKYQKERPEIKSIEDYKNVAPDFNNEIKSIMIEGMKIAGLPE